MNCDQSSSFIGESSFSSNNKNKEKLGKEKYFQRPRLINILKAIFYLDVLLCCPKFQVLCEKSGEN